MISNAVISDCGVYRYRLDRSWADGPCMGFIMLNPSTADAMKDDPTIRRCISFARREGCGRLVVVNLFPYRATLPASLWAAPEPVRSGGAPALHALTQAANEADVLVAAWGANTKGAEHTALALFGDRLLCLGTTRAGKPRHPLYVRGDAPLVKLAN